MSSMESNTVTITVKPVTTPSPTLPSVPVSAESDTITITVKPTTAPTPIPTPAPPTPTPTPPTPTPAPSLSIISAIAYPSKTTVYIGEEFMIKVKVTFNRATTPEDGKRYIIRTYYDDPRTNPKAEYWPAFDQNLWINSTTTEAVAEFTDYVGPPGLKTYGPYYPALVDITTGEIVSVAKTNTVTVTFIPGEPKVKSAVLTTEITQVLLGRKLPMRVDVNLTHPVPRYYADNYALCFDVLVNETRVRRMCTGFAVGRDKVTAEFGYLPPGPGKFNVKLNILMVYTGAERSSYLSMFPISDVYEKGPFEIKPEISRRYRETPLYTTNTVTIMVQEQVPSPPTPTPAPPPAVKRVKRPLLALIVDFLLEITRGRLPKVHEKLENIKEKYIET